jgi:HlyD family secretion protein
VGDPTALEVIVDVLSTDAVRIGAGDSVEIVDWGGDRPLTARVRRVEPSAYTRVSALGVEEQRANVLIDLPSPPSELGDGFRVEVRTTIWSAANVLIVPSSALFQHGDVWSVFMLDEGRARRRAVQVGHRTSAVAEVISGLTAGETVILFPSDQIADGTRARPRVP